MGKTPQPLTILVDDAWLEHPEVQALREKGHQIALAPAADLILSPAAHAWDDDMWPYLGVALRAARERRKENSRA